MNLIYHLTSRTAWEAAQASGMYTTEALAREGFIHCSTAAQVERVAQRFYRDVSDLVVLTIDPTRLTAQLIYEAPAHPDGQPAPELDAERFPHVYGALNLDAVIQVSEFRVQD